MHQSVIVYNNSRYFWFALILSVASIVAYAWHDPSGPANGGTWLGHYPLKFSPVGGLWSNRIYVLGAFTAFVSTVVLVQHLTRVVIARMTAKELEAIIASDA